jgi:hypothetical protein
MRATTVQKGVCLDRKKQGLISGAPVRTGSVSGPHWVRKTIQKQI